MARGQSLIGLAVLVTIFAGSWFREKTMERQSWNDQVGVWDNAWRNGTRYTVTTRSNDTDGNQFQIHVAIRPGAQGFYPGKPGSLPMHLHNTQLEEFLIVSGTASYVLNTTVGTLSAGDILEVQPGMPHTLWNSGSDPLEFLITFAPGSPLTETFFENLAGMSRQAGTESTVNPFQLLLLFVEADSQVTEVPLKLWPAVKAVVVPLAYALGFRAHYPQYISRAGEPIALEDDPPVDYPTQEQQPAPADEEAKPAPAVVAVVEDVPPAAVAEADAAPVEAAAAAATDEVPAGAVEDGGLLQEEGLQEVDAQHMGVA